jgi:hypothetical protein
VENHSYAINLQLYVNEQLTAAVELINQLLLACYSEGLIFLRATIPNVPSIIRI